jgi:hypothetical protein
MVSTASLVDHCLHRHRDIVDVIAGMDLTSDKTHNKVAALYFSNRVRFEKTVSTTFEIRRPKGVDDGRSREEWVLQGVSEASHGETERNQPHSPSSAHHLYRRHLAHHLDSGLRQDRWLALLTVRKHQSLQGSMTPIFRTNGSTVPTGARGRAPVVP